MRALGAWSASVRRVKVKSATASTAVSDTAVDQRAFVAQVHDERRDEPGL